MKNKIGKTIVIDVGNQFSKVPSGVRYSDGDFNAEAFMIHILEDFLSDGYVVQLDFSNTIQVGSCFLKSLAEFVVASHSTNYVEVVKDDKWEWSIARWNNYIKEAEERYNSGEL